jgi:Fic family protein
MPRPQPEEEIQAIENAVRQHPSGIGASEIAAALPAELPRRTLQYRLKYLVDSRRLIKEGEGRWARYRLPVVSEARGDAAGAAEAVAAIIPLSPGATEIRDYLRQPAAARKPVGYNREFLESYRPNVTSYLSAEDRARLAEIGKATFKSEPAGTYAKHILSRLLIDLSWNSSRLEGNTYSLLDTRRLIEFGQAAEGRDRHDAQMILNHKEAIEFLVGSAGEIGFNRFTLLNLHAILANNLLPDETAAGKLRHIAVGIEKSAFHPLEVPQLIEECFDQILATAAAIEDPFEQAIFVMVHLPYLQPFDDVNKRVSRLAANIPFIKNNLSPLSFTDLPSGIYTDAVLGVYELNRIELLRDVFLWAYQRSAARYAAVRQSLGEPDPFRLKYRAALREIVGAVIHAHMDRKSAVAHIESWAKANIEAAAQEKFREMAETELLGLHGGNFARYQITPREFDAWQQVWTPTRATQ